MHKRTNNRLTAADRSALEAVVAKGPMSTIIARCAFVGCYSRSLVGLRLRVIAIAMGLVGRPDPSFGCAFAHHNTANNRPILDGMKQPCNPVAGEIHLRHGFSAAMVAVLGGNLKKTQCLWGFFLPFRCRNGELGFLGGRSSASSPAAVADGCIMIGDGLPLRRRQANLTDCAF
jgi:hypothetical protein